MDGASLIPWEARLGRKMRLRLTGSIMAWPRVRHLQSGGMATGMKPGHGKITVSLTDTTFWFDERAHFLVESQDVNNEPVSLPEPPG